MQQVGVACIRLHVGRGAQIGGSRQRSDAAASSRARPGSSRSARGAAAAGGCPGRPTRTLGAWRHLSTAGGGPGATMGRGWAGVGRRRAARPLRRPGRQHKQQQ